MKRDIGKISARYRHLNEKICFANKFNKSKFSGVYKVGSNKNHFSNFINNQKGVKMHLEVDRRDKGTNRVIEEMLENKLPEPKFQNLSGGFEVVLTGPGREFEEEIEKEKLHVLEINERQRKAIKYMMEEGKITTKEYVKLAKTSLITAKRDLLDLKEKGMIEYTGSLRKGHYRFTKNDPKNDPKNDTKKSS